MTYRTRFFDNQIHFGSGSLINANDIPNSTTRFWLTNSLQAISGSKIFENGIRTNGNFYANYDGPDGDSYLYFYEGGSATGRHLKWDDSDNQFEFNYSVFSAGSITADWHLMSNGNIYANRNGPDGDSYLYFYEGGSATGASLMFNDSLGIFRLSHALNMTQHKICNVTDPILDYDAATKNYVDTFVKGSIYKSSTLGNIPSGNNVTVTHNLSSDYLLIELMYAPVAGDHADKWINAEGVLYYEIQSSDSLKVFNEGDLQIDDGKVRISIIGL